MKAQRKVIPMQGVKGSFKFNAVAGTAIADEIDKLIWGIKKNEEYNFERALKAINKDYRQLFYDMSLGSIGKKAKVEFDLVLENGKHTHHHKHVVEESDDRADSLTPLETKGNVNEYQPQSNQNRLQSTQFELVPNLGTYGFNPVKDVWVLSSEDIYFHSPVP